MATKPKEPRKKPSVGFTFDYLTQPGANRNAFLCFVLVRAWRAPTRPHEALLTRLFAPSLLQKDCTAAPGGTCDKANCDCHLL